jgi:hypothetical protein
VAGTCECGNEPSGSIKCGKFLTSCKPVSFSRRTVLHGVSKYFPQILASTKVSIAISVPYSQSAFSSCISPHVSHIHQVFGNEEKHQYHW